MKLVLEFYLILILNNMKLHSTKLYSHSLHSLQFIFSCQNYFFSTANTSGGKSEKLDKDSYFCE
jgi:hypothetical protein